MPRLLLLLTLLLCVFSSAAPARELRGDWGSSGLPMRPIDPPYPYLYACQAEVTDSVVRQGDGHGVPAGRPYRLYAVNRFSLSNGEKSWGAKDGWYWVAKLLDEADFDRDLIKLAQPPKGAFETDGSAAMIGFQNVDGADHDKVKLTAMVTLPIGIYRTTERNSMEAERSDVTIRLRVEASAYRDAGQQESLPKTLQRNLFLACDKQK